MAESLARAYAEHEPGDAARALEELPADEAALFIAELPARLAGPLLEQMAAALAAKCLSLLPARQAAAALMEIDDRGCAAILRSCGTDTRRRLLSELPPRRVQHFSRSLAYTLDVVGAWIDYDVPALAGQRTVAEALHLLRERNRPDDGLVFVLRGGHHYSGVVSTATLLHHEPGTPLARVTDTRVRALSDAVEVDEIESLEDWDECALLPVTGPDGSLLGGLSRAGLRRALHSVYPQAPAAQPDSLLAHLFGAYLHSAAEMSRLLLGRDVAAAVPKAGDEH